MERLTVRDRPVAGIHFLMNLDRLKRVTIDKREAFEAALAVQQRLSCESNFANIFMWSEVYDTYYTEIDNRIVVLNLKVAALLFPFGQWFEPAQLEQHRADLSATMGIDLSWGDVPREYIETHAAALCQYYIISTTPDEDDYILSVENLAELSGRGHQNTRRLIRQFGEQVPGWRLIEITPDNSELARQFAMAQIEAERPGDFLDDESLAITRAFNNFSQLGLEGVLLISPSGEPQAFSVYSFTRPDTCNVHFEKADRQIRGAAQTIRVSLAQHLLQRAKWINLEQDLGNPGLRRSKASYMPEQLLPRYRLSKIAGTEK